MKNGLVGTVAEVGLTYPTERTDMHTDATIGVLQEDGTILALYYFEDGKGKFAFLGNGEGERFRAAYATIKDWLSAFPKCQEAYLFCEEGVHTFTNVFMATGMRLGENYKPLRDENGEVPIIEYTRWFDQEAKTVTDLVVSQL